MEIIKTCPFCGKTTTIENVDEEAYFLWNNGILLAQQAFPTMPTADRETLISGMCPHCQGSLFGDELEEDEEDEGEHWEDEFEDYDCEEGFDPYCGCWTGDC